MEDEISNTQYLLKIMDTITGENHDVSVSEITGTQQIISNTDNITATQSEGSHDNIAATESTGGNDNKMSTQSAGSHDNLTAFQSTGSHGNITSTQSTGSDDNITSTQSTGSHDNITSTQSTCSHDNITSTQSTGSTVELTSSVHVLCVETSGDTSSQTRIGESEANRITCNVLKVPRVDPLGTGPITFDIIAPSGMSGEHQSDLKTDSLEVTTNTSDNHQSNVPCEPPSKKAKVNPNGSKPVLQFVPRNVNQAKSAALKQSNKTFVNPNITDVSDNRTKGDNSLKSFHFGMEINSEQKTSMYNRGDNSQTKSSLNKRTDCESMPNKYDANVVLPADIVRLWRTSREVKEGEIIEVERDCDTLFTSQPVCFARGVTDFNHTEDNYLRGCKWSPDGTCLLTNSNDNKLRIFSIPSSTTNDIELISNKIVKESDTVYDFCWYNKMSSADSSTCCFLTTCRDGPVHMWDMNTGELKCTYRPYNHLDELSTAHSLAISLDGSKLYTGFNRMIRVFDIGRPGRQCIERPTFVKHQGQPGIISCIAASPQGGGIYAAGSYARGIALYHEPEGNMLCMFEGQQGGVTHIAFSPDGTKLYSGGRKDPEILCWDLRKPGQILFVALRPCETNQRLYFDQDGSGQHLVSGCHDGTICIWDTLRPPVKVLPESDPLLKPVMKYKAHNDCVNGVSINPVKNWVSTCSGQRHYPDLGDSEDSDSDSMDKNMMTCDNSVKIWKFDT